MTWKDAPRDGDRSASDRLVALRRSESERTVEPPLAPQPPQWSARPNPQKPAGESVVETTAPLPVVAPPQVLLRLLDRWVPAGWREVRLDPGRRGAVALSVVAVVAALIVAIGVWRGRPVEQIAPPLTSIAAPTEGAHPPTELSSQPRVEPAGTAPLVVSVVGRVRHPGLVSLPTGSRVADAIGKAGGPLRGVDLSPLNLARRLSDGEQVAVGVPAPSVQPADSAAAGDGAPSTGPINLNLATADQLDGLPGVGPVTAHRIVDWRTKHGRFSSVNQLREIPGIGERKFAQLKALVTV